MKIDDKSTLQTHTVSESPDASRTDQEIAQRNPWFHNLHLPDGTQTAPEHPLGDFPAFKWKQIERYLPENLTDWSALDIGCNAGFYSLQLAQRGAQVTGIDNDPHYLDQAKWAREKFSLPNKPEFHQKQVYDFLGSTESYDLVWFMGVFYHLRYPLLALDLLASMTRKLLVFQTLELPTSKDEPAYQTPPDVKFTDRQKLAEPGWPRMAFVEHSLAKDITNWWVADRNCVRAMLHSAGLRILHEPGQEIYICEPIHDGPPNPNAREQLQTLHQPGR